MPSVHLIERKFYSRNTIDVAKDLLGKILVRIIDGKVISGAIVESEAYRSTDDPASHSHRGKTERNSVMFGEVGHAYVYFTYGNHYCLNIVAKEDNTPAGAVLIRAIEPIEGISFMRRYRKTSDPYNLTSGPGKLTQALKVTKRQNGVDVTKKEELYVVNGKHIDESEIVATSRIGIRVALNKPWRFLIVDNEFVSRKIKMLNR
ncbi:MAG TPA: DNA-3-methyladenine glycosylase [Nitrososphaerales archaeon]|nr:DNA-3-methyladenine glycosylase [Nitrososphaerales archaeon]